VYTFLRLRKLNRFEAYYREVGHIERVARGLEQDPDAPTTPKARRTYLAKRLSVLKCRVLEDFAEGGLKGEASVTAIIAAINATRSTLSVALASGREQQSSAVPSSPAEKEDKGQPVGASLHPAILPRERRGWAALFRWLDQLFGV
jgi:hypothetical protein